LRAFADPLHDQLVSTFPLDLDPFAVPESPQLEPREIRAGDTIQWARAYDEYPPGTEAGYTLTYTFVSQTATIQINGAMVAANNSENFNVTVPASVTALWAAGHYRWQAYIMDNQANRWTVAEGVVEILPNLQVTTAGLDDRAPDEITLANIDLMLAGKATADVQEYKVFERELRRYTWKELLEVRSVYYQRVRKLRIDRGEIPRSRTIGVRFQDGY
jgi:hypothetical protein